MASRCLQAITASSKYRVKFTKERMFGKVGKLGNNWSNLNMKSEVILCYFILLGYAEYMFLRVLGCRQITGVSGNAA